MEEKGKTAEEEYVKVKDVEMVGRKGTERRE